jgi:hypothetical protein
MCCGDNVVELQLYMLTSRSVFGVPSGLSRALLFINSTPRPLLYMLEHLKVAVSTVSSKAFGLIQTLPTARYFAD